MDVGEGMVVLVRGLRDANLAVTLLDGNRKYTLMPNNAKSITRSQTSPSRKTEANSNRSQKISEGEPNYRTKEDKSLTRDSRSEKCDAECADFRRAVFRNYDVRYFREVLRKTRDSTRSIPTQRSNSVNMETQAAVEMTSKEAATAPRDEHSNRNVAVTLSPTTSTIKRNNEETMLRIKMESTIINPRQYSNVVYTNLYDNDLKNFKSVQTSNSITNIEGLHDYHKDLKRSRSHEDNRKDTEEGLIEDDVLQWWQLYRNKHKMNKWEERFQRIAEKLKKPGGEEKLRLKIEKYLKNVPSYFSDYDDDSEEFRRNLPEMIIKKLKKHCLGNNKEYQSNLEEVRSEVPKYESRINMNNYKAIIKRWFEIITTNNKVIKDDIIEYIVHKIEPLTLDKPNFDVEFKYLLKSNLIDILNEISINIEYKDKRDYLNRVTDDLIEDLLRNDIKNISINRVKNVGVNCKVGIQSLRPTEKDMNDLTIDSLTQLLKTSQTCISAQKKRILERKLVSNFMNIINTLTSDMNKEDISKKLQWACELSEYQDEHFENKLINNLDDSFWKMGQKYGNEEEVSKFLTNASNSSTSVMYNNIKNESRELSENKMSYKNFDHIHHYQKLEDEIKNWLQMKDTFLFEDVTFEKTVIRDLIENISRCDTLVQNNLQSVKYEIWKWLRKHVGHNIIQHINVQDLVEKVMHVTESAIKCHPGQFDQSFVCQNLEVIPGPSTQQNLSYVEELIDIIFEWYHEQPYNVVGSLDASLDSHLIKELAERIYTRILSKENPNDVIDNEVDSWFKHFLEIRPDVILDKNLKSKIKNVTFRKKNIDKQNLDKDVLKIYENSIDKWLDQLTKDPVRRDNFDESKNMLVKELAARLYEIKKTQGELSNGIVNKKMKREVSEWLIKVPIHPKLNTGRKRNEMAKMLMDIIKEFNLPSGGKEKSMTMTEESLKECDIIDWLKAQPLYIKNNASDKLKQETCIKELGNLINELKNGRNLNINEELVKYVKKLDLKQEYGDEVIQETIADLKMFLRNIDNEIFPNNEDNNLMEIVKQWLQSLPLNVTSAPEHTMVKRIMKELFGFIHQAKINCSSDKDQLLEAIKKNIKLLPIECKTKCNEQFLNHYSNSLFQQLNKIGKLRFVINKNNENEHNYIKSPLRALDDTKNFNVDIYITKLTEQIEEWLTDLQLPEHKEKGLRAVVINELAKDIIDREKYLEMNPSSRGTNIEEIDHLKFQIFKWINKLVVEDNLKTVDHAPELMQRIQSIRDIQKNNVAHIGVNTRQSLGAGRSTYGISKPANSKVSRMPMLDVPGPGGSLAEGLRKRSNEPQGKRFSNPLGYPVDYIPKSYINNGYEVPDQNNQNQRNSSNTNQQANPLGPLVNFQPEPAEPYQAEVTELPDGTTVEQIYQEYDEVFRQRSNEIPLVVSTPDEQTLASFIRQGIINIIWNTYFKLKSNPEIENDYEYVELLMDEALDEIFNDLPATDAIQRIKHIWKSKVVQDVVTMLKRVHDVTDTSIFKFLLYSKKTRVIAKAAQEQTNREILNYFVVTTADMYLTLKKYNEQDPVKANIYKLRLTNYIENLVRRVEFYGITNEQLHRVRMKVFSALNNVPVPETDILPSELNEVEIGYVIENWFKELPGIIPEREAVEQTWSRLRQLLARKINALERRIYTDEFELDRMIMHETSQFLETPGMLCDDNDLQINEMVEDLAARLREKRQNEAIPLYTSFEQNRPLCSSMIQANPNVVQVPTSRDPIQQYSDNRLNNNNKSTPISSNVSRRDDHVHSRAEEPNQPLMLADVVQSPRMSQAGLINLPKATPQVFINNVGQAIHPNVIKSIHEQMGGANIMNASPHFIQQEFVNEGVPSNRTKPPVTGHLSQIRDPGSPRQALGENLVNISMQGMENQHLQYSRYSPEFQIASGPSNTGFPANQIPAPRPQTHLNTVPPAQSSQEFLPSSIPTSIQRTRSTVRVGDVANEIIEERVGRSRRCTCAGRYRCDRRKYVCSCGDDDDEDVLYVPCRYYF